MPGAAADQWKDVFCATEMGSDLLLARGKKIAGQSRSNTASGSVIMDGSIIIVGEGKCVIVTEGSMLFPL